MVATMIEPEKLVWHRIYGEGIVESVTSSGSSAWVLWEDGEIRCHPIEDISISN